jgi:hypothetical protein
MDPEGTPTALDARLLEGLTLADRDEFYEAHESLEELWGGEIGAPRHVLQALIQVVVALHHRCNGNLAGARTLLTRAREHCDAVAGPVLGLDARELSVRCGRLLEEADEAERLRDRAAEGTAPPLDRALIPRFHRLRAEIRAERARRGLDPEPPIAPPR